MPKKMKFEVKPPEEKKPEPQPKPEIETWEDKGGTVEMEEDFDKPE